MNMSFSTLTKNELSRIPIKNNCCMKAELASLLKTNGSIQINGKRKIHLKLITENAAIARRIFTLLKTLYNSEIEVMVRKNRQLKKNNSYFIVISNSQQTIEILKDLGLIEDILSKNCLTTYKIPKKLVEKRCCKRAYIRGAFLGGGSISNPEKTYHLEFVVNSLEHAEGLSRLINSFSLNSKIVLRKENYVVYLKEGEQIVDLLNIMGAHSALLDLENIRVIKEVRNNINRIVNCETANLGKTIDASLRQIENIEYIKSTIGLNKIPKSLSDLAYVRLSHKDSSLKELGKMLDPPVGKSGVNHRFRKIENIAEDIKRERRN